MSAAIDLSPQLAWIARLIAFDTTSRLSNTALIDDVAAYAAQFGLSVRRVPNADGSKAGLFFTVGPMVPGGVVLSGHSDVVPVDGQDWTSDPFRAALRDGRLYGRGAADMKGFLGIALSLLPEMAAAPLARPIHFAISYDEEDGLVGAPPLIAALQEAIPPPTAVIVGEPSELAIVAAHKGIVAYRTTVLGHEAHSSQPAQGQSAIMAAAGLLHRIDLIAERLAASPHPDCAFVPPHSTISVGLLSGGTAPNILARRCEFVWDVRAVTLAEQEEIVGEVLAAGAALDRRIRARFADCAVVNEKLADAPPLSPTSDNAAVALIRRISGANGVEVASYAAEAGMFQRAGLATAIWGPGSIAQAHQPDEYLELSQVEAATLLLRRLVAHLCEPG